MVTTLPRVHVVVTGIEKVIPTLEDLSLLLRLLPRSATGQSHLQLRLAAHRRQAAGRAGRPRAPVLHPGRQRPRRSASAREFQDMLRCIRCGACMNHCPVYQTIGGHAYGWVYPGPMGSVLTPLYIGLDKALDLPHAATLCNQCGVVCPVKIPLPELLRKLREKQVETEAAAVDRTRSPSRPGPGWRRSRSSMRWAPGSACAISTGWRMAAIASGVLAAAPEWTLGPRLPRARRQDLPRTVRTTTKALATEDSWTCVFGVLSVLCALCGSDLTSCTRSSSSNGLHPRRRAAARVPARLGGVSADARPDEVLRAAAGRHHRHHQQGGAARRAAGAPAEAAADRRAPPPAPTTSISTGAAPRIVGTNIRGYAVNAVPEHVLMLMLALRRKVLAYRADVAAGKWQQAAHVLLLRSPDPRPCAAARIGIVGRGSLGQGVARLAQAFGMRSAVGRAQGRRRSAAGLRLSGKCLPKPM